MARYDSEYQREVKSCFVIVFYDRYFTVGMRYTRLRKRGVFALRLDHPRKLCAFARVTCIDDSGGRDEIDATSFWRASIRV